MVDENVSHVALVIANEVKMPLNAKFNIKLSKSICANGFFVAKLITTNYAVFLFYSISYFCVCVCSEV